MIDALRVRFFLRLSTVVSTFERSCQSLPSVFAATFWSYMSLFAVGRAFLPLAKIIRIPFKPRRNVVSLSAAHYLTVIAEVNVAPCIPTFVWEHFAVEPHQFVQFGFVAVQPSEHYDLIANTRD